MSNPLRARVRLRSALCAALVACAALTPMVALAWGGAGHRLVAELAEAQLTPAARAEVNRLLALEPGATLVSVSTWADDIRNPTTGGWHYINFQRGECDAPPARLCIQGACVVDAIERQAAVLASSAPDEERLKALKYVVHFVADVHQPLHAGYADDRGGNTYQVQAFGRGTNLHAIWDSALIQQWPEGPDALRLSVQAEIPSADPGGAVGAWAAESCRIVSSPEFYPDGHKLDARYQELWAGTLKQRLAAASRRLARMLNEVALRRE